MMLMSYHSILKESLVDGPGKRVTIFMQGCPIQCPGCQNRHLWPEDGDKTHCTATVAPQLLMTDLPVTISGGEPFAQPEALADLVIRLKMADRHVIVYSGFVYEDLLLMAEAIPEIVTVLALADVLVDGPYVRWLDHDRMQYRGSANQRAIDLVATNYFGSIMVLDWDIPEVTITADGDLIGAKSIVDDFANMGPGVSTRRCGQIRKGSQ